MTKEEAKKRTRLSGREYPEGKMEFLRCQLGEMELKSVPVSAQRSLNVSVFRLVAYGESWEKAVGMWEVGEREKG